MSKPTKHIEYHESGIQFTFDENWIVQKYDRHTYFQGLAGAGLKGVDFIGFFENQQLMLMEVKNFRRRPGITSNPLEPYLDEPERLIETFEEKVEDTLKAIHAIVTYYQRSWLYRMISPIIRRLPVSVKDRIFWTHAYESSIDPDTLSLVLWLELDEDQSEFWRQFEPLFREKLSRLSNHVYLSNVNHPTFNNGLTTEIKII